MSVQHWGNSSCLQLPSGLVVAGVAVISAAIAVAGANELQDSTANQTRKKTLMFKSNTPECVAVLSTPFLPVVCLRNNRIKQ